MRIRKHLRPIALILVLAMLPTSVLGALSASMAWEVRTTGSDTACAGGFRGGAYIAVPSAPTVTGAGTGGTVAAGTYYVVVTYTDGLGETSISGQTSVTTTGTTSKITITSPAASTGAQTWNAYSGTTSGGPYFPISAGLTIGVDLVRTTTPPTSGTQPRGTDRTLQNAAQVNVDNAAITATTAGAASNVLTFTGYTPTAADVGNVFRATGGTNINVAFYEITGITSTTWTVTGAANLTTGGGAGSAITGVMGGAFASPGQAMAAALTNTNHVVYLAAGTYTVANGTNNTATNKFTATQVNLIGYSTNRRPFNTDTKPVLDAGAASMTVATFNGTSNLFDNLSFTNSGNNATATAIAASTNQGVCHNIAISGYAVPINNSGTANAFIAVTMSGCGVLFGTGNGAYYLRCTNFTSTAGAFAQGGQGLRYEECLAVAPPGTAFLLGSSSFARNCVAYGATGVNGDGFIVNGNYVVVENCLAYGNAVRGFRNQGGSGGKASIVRNCAAGANVTNYETALASYQVLNCVTLTVDPFTNAAGNDFSLNATAGGGAACRATGLPGTWPGLSTTGYRDIGAAQTSAGGPGGGGFRPRPRTSFNLMPDRKPAAPRVMHAASESEWRKAG